MTAKIVLALPDTPLHSRHGAYLAPFFSSTSFHSFRTSMSALADQLNQAASGNEVAKTVASNIEEWADQLALRTRELLQLAIEKRTQFTLDMIYWITGMSEILIAIAKAPATREHTREQLKKHADWLFCSLSFIPRDTDTVQWIEHFSFIEDVFNFAMMAENRKWDDGFDRAWSFLLKWGFEGGHQQTGWNTLENCLAALAALALRRGDERRELLLSQVQGAALGDGAPSRETLDHTARGLREKAIEIRENDFEINPINHVLARIDGAGARELLIEIANILSPHTADEPVRMRP